MFDRYVVTARPQHVYQHTDVHEHRAPTDESIALLKEFQEKAENKVIASVAVESNTFNCVVQTWKDAISDRFIARAIFDLNGIKMTVQEDVSGIDAADKQKLLLKLRDAVATEIANKILFRALKDVRL